MLCDNSTAVACINRFGTDRSLEWDSPAQEIWVWAAKANIWLCASHLPGVQGFEADLETRKQEIYTEWKLKESVFQFLCRELDFSPSTDLFITKINIQLPILASYRPAPDCFAVNAFLLDWVKNPFACLTEAIQKIHHDGPKGILIPSDWPSQPIYLRLKELSVMTITIPSRKTNLYLPNQLLLHHPLYNL